MRYIIYLLLPAFFATFNCFAQFNVNENFSGDDINSNLWLSYLYSGSGTFSQNNGRLEYTCEEEFNYRYLTKAFPASYDQDFTIIFRTGNVTDAEDLYDYAQIGVRIFSQFVSDKWFDVNHGSYYVSNFGGSRDIISRFISNSGNTLGTAIQPSNTFPQSAIIKIEFDSSSKIFKVSYDENPTDGIIWTELSTFSVGPTNNGLNHLNFGMSTGSSFLIHIYGLSYGIDIDSDELVIDDFQAFYDEDLSLSENDSITISFESELGKAYKIAKNSDLNSNTGVYLDTQKNENLFLLVPQGTGSSFITGTGSTIDIIDTTDNLSKAFYKVETQ